MVVKFYFIYLSANMITTTKLKQKAILAADHHGLNSGDDQFSVQSGKIFEIEIFKSFLLFTN